MDSRRDFTSKKVFPGHFSELGEKANSALIESASPLVKHRAIPHSGEGPLPPAIGLFQLGVVLASIPEHKPKSS